MRGSPETDQNNEYFGCINFTHQSVHTEQIIWMPTKLFCGTSSVSNSAGFLSCVVKTRLARVILVVFRANGLLEDPKGNLDPAGREKILRALTTFTSA